MSEEHVNDFLFLSSLKDRIRKEGRKKEKGVMRPRPVSASASRQTQVRAGFTFFNDPVNQYPVNQGTCNSRPDTGVCNSQPDTGRIA